MYYFGIHEVCEGSSPWEPVEIVHAGETFYLTRVHYRDPELRTVISANLVWGHDI